MKITEITRTISGFNYSNISAKATIEDGEDVTIASLKLDDILKKTIKEIEDRDNKRLEAEGEKRKAERILEDALEHVRNQEIPF